ncbi:MAG TPA: hypothetical protein VIL20_26285, partial [Sandaracinaceae bacterium]
MKRAALVFAFVLAASCTTYRRGQVIVTIDAEPGVVQLSNPPRVLVRIWGRDANGEFDDDMLLMETGTRFPWRVAVRPRDEDIRRVFRIEAQALDAAGEPIAVARLISGYEEGRVLHAYLLLQDACIGVPCTDLSSTCRDGRCIEIPEEPTYFDPDAGFPDTGTPPCEPGGEETCNHGDDDCDGQVDEGFDLRSDEAHCGACGRLCDPARATGACVAGSCTIQACDDGWADCDGRADNGCEAQLGTAERCADCDRSCGGSTPLCDGGECVAMCPDGLTPCPPGACVDTMTSTMHCGGCGRICPERPFTTVECVGGVCVYECAPGRESCSGDPGDADGCEQDIDGDPRHCGGCGQACPAEPCRDPICTGGACGWTPRMSGTTCDS